MKSLSRVRLLVTPWTAAHQTPPSMGFSRQEFPQYKLLHKKEALMILGQLDNYIKKLILKKIILLIFLFIFPQTLNFLLCIDVSPVNNVVVVSGEQLRDSATHIHVSILPQPLLLCRPVHNIKQRSMCYTGGLCWLSILIEQYVHDLPKVFPLATISHFLSL